MDKQDETNERLGDVAGDTCINFNDMLNKHMGQNESGDNASGNILESQEEVDEILNEYDH